MSGYVGSRPLAELVTWSGEGSPYLGAAGREPWDALVADPVAALTEALEAMAVPVAYFVPADAGATWQSRINGAAVAGNVAPRTMDRVGAPVFVDDGGLGFLRTSPGNGYHAEAVANPFPAGIGFSIAFWHNPNLSAGGLLAYQGPGVDSNVSQRVRLSGANTYQFQARTDAVSFTTNPPAAGVFSFVEWAVPPNATVGDVTAFVDGGALPVSGTVRPDNPVDVTGDTFVWGGKRESDGTSTFLNHEIGLTIMAVGRPFDASERAAIVDALGIGA